MKAKLLFRDKIIDEEGDMKERVVWSVPPGDLYPAGVRYRLAFIPRGAARSAILYDNHHPKGHHRHLEGREEPYDFDDTKTLQSDFERDVARWKKARRTR